MYCFLLILLICVCGFISSIPMLIVGGIHGGIHSTNFCGTICTYEEQPGDDLCYSRVTMPYCYENYIRDLGDIVYGNKVSTSCELVNTSFFCYMLSASPNSETGCFSVSQHKPTKYYNNLTIAGIVLLIASSVVAIVSILLI